MNNPYILTVEDEQDIRDLIVYHLSSVGYKVRSAASAESGFEIALTTPPTLILLDIMLPGMNGIELCRKIRLTPELSAVPIIMLTAKGSDLEITSGLDAGADDYIIKPFNIKVLIARVKAVLRRVSANISFDDLHSDSLKRRNITIFPIKREVLVDNTIINLTYSEFEVLRLMLSYPGRVFTRAQIINSIRGQDYPVSDRSVDVIITSLRKKMGKEGESIETLRGVGYRFSEIDN